ncbi:MAG: DUF2520 domain-containing protein [Paludibacter sp.]
MEIVFIGSGNVATHLAVAFKEMGVVVKQVFSKNIANAETLAEKVDAEPISDISKLYKDADFYFYALKDNALRTILMQIDMPAGIQVHTGGTMSIKEFDGFSTRFGVFYPLQTFSLERSIEITNTPILIEGCSMDVQKQLLALAGIISDKVILMNSESRMKVHLAAVFACNFSNYLCDIASQILVNSGISFDLILPLIEETAEKLKTLSPYEAQTGPAVRMDEMIISKHLDLLNKNSEHKEIYKLLTKSIIKRHKR